MLTHGVLFSFSQEGLVGARNLNALVVHLAAVGSMLGLVTTVVTLVAKYAFKYEDNLFVVKPPRDGHSDREV
jgi:hypothetical protein